MFFKNKHSLLPGSKKTHYETLLITVILKLFLACTPSEAKNSTCPKPPNFYQSMEGEATNKKGLKLILVK